MEPAKLETIQNWPIPTIQHISSFSAYATTTTNISIFFHSSFSTVGPFMERSGLMLVLYQAICI